VDGGPVTVAGLWDEWKNIETGEPLKSCTMIITTANEFTSDTHDRMPVILEAGAFAPGCPEDQVPSCFSRQRTMSFRNGRSRSG